jgi:hypothetical protein
VLLCMPAEVVATNCFPLLAGRDLVRLNSANLSRLARQVLTVAYAMSPPVSLPTTTKHAEHVVWGWFWKRSMSVRPSPNLTVPHLAMMIGNEHLVNGNIYLTYNKPDYSLLCAKVLNTPLLTVKISSLRMTVSDNDDPILRYLASFTSLQELHISASKARSDAAFLTVLRSVAPLYALRIACMLPVTDAVMDALSRQTQTLTELTVSWVLRSGVGLYRLAAQCRSLRVLQLRCILDPAADGPIPIPATYLAAIAVGCPMLEVLCIQDADPNTDTLAMFAIHCPSLRSIESSESLLVTDAGLTALARTCSRLTTLDSATWAVTDEAAVRAASPVLSRLQHVKLYGQMPCVPANSHTLGQALAHMCDLRSLSLWNFALDGAQLGTLAPHCTTLTTLHVCHNSKLSGDTAADAVAAIVTRNPLLQELQLPGRAWLQHSSLTAIAASCPLLRELRAHTSEPSTITDAVAVALVQGCRHLTTVQGISGPQLTDVSVLAFAEYCPRLVSLTVEHSPQVTEAALTTLVQKCCDLAILLVCKSTVDGAVAGRLTTGRSLKVSVPGHVRLPNGELWTLSIVL